MAATARRNTSTVRYNRSASALSRANFHCSSSVIAFCLPVVSCTARSMRCFSMAFCSLSSRITDYLVPFFDECLPFSFRFSVRFLTSRFNDSENDRLICSFSFQCSSSSFLSCERPSIEDLRSSRTERHPAHAPDIVCLAVSDNLSACSTCSMSGR